MNAPHQCKTYYAFVRPKEDTILHWKENLQVQMHRAVELLLAAMQLLLLACPAEVLAVKLLVVVVSPFHQTGSNSRVSVLWTVFSCWQDNEIKLLWRPDLPKFPQFKQILVVSFLLRQGLIYLTPVLEVNLKYCYWKYILVRARSVPVRFY